MSAQRPSTRTIIGGLVVAILCAPVAEAGLRVRIPMRAAISAAQISKIDQARLLSRAQLQRCVTLEQSVNSLADELERMTVELAKLERKLAALDEELTVLEPTVDEYDEASVNRFNALVTQYQRLRSDYNEQGVPGINDGIAKHNIMVDQFNAGCADRYYTEEDMRAVRGVR
jgi:septal ring factor EnvC (AmiA/AmiB activator)